MPSWCGHEGAIEDWARLFDNASGGAKAECAYPSESSSTLKRGSYMSRVVEFAEAGGPEVLRFKNVDVPEAGPGQVRIRVKAIGLNRAESMWRENKYIEPVQFPARRGSDAVGTVDSVGKDVTTIAVGGE